MIPHIGKQRAMYAELAIDLVTELKPKLFPPETQITLEWTKLKNRFGIPTGRIPWAVRIHHHSKSSNPFIRLTMDELSQYKWRETVMKRMTSTTWPGESQQLS